MDKITRYMLSDDKAGLMAYFKNGTSYHIHSDELSFDQVLVRNQLLEMEMLKPWWKINA